MKQNKIVLIVLTLIMSVCLACSLAACVSDYECTQHEWSNTVVLTAPTCTTKGVQEQKCKWCDEKQTVEIDALEHLFSEDWSTDENGHYNACTRDNCTEKANQAAHLDEDKDHMCDICLQTCSVCVDVDADGKCDICGNNMTVCKDDDNDHLCDDCGDKLSDCDDEDKNHKCDICGADMGEHKAAEDSHICDYCNQTASEHTGGTATCTEQATCTVCGEKYGNALGHNSDGEVDHKDADCTNDGVVGGTYCSRCNDGKSAAETIIPAKGHNYTAETVDAKYLKSAATCISPAVYYKSCTDCGKSSKDEVDEATFESGNAKGHNYGDITYTLKDDLTAFIATRTCSDCAEGVEGHTQTATSVDWAYLEITTQSTCTETGVAKYNVTFDVDWIDGNQIVSAWYRKSGHKYTLKKYDATYHWKECSVCFEMDESSKGTHTYDEPVVDKDYLATPATCMVKATYYYSCTCGAKGTETFEDSHYAKHTFNDDAWQDEVPATCKNTGTKGHKDCSVCNKHFDNSGNEIEDLTIAVDPNGHKYVNNVCTYCDAKHPSIVFYLVGQINGEDCGDDSDYENTGNYKFDDDGKVTVGFTTDSYVFVKNADNSIWYMANGDIGQNERSAYLYSSVELGSNAKKIYIPANTKATFTIKIQEDAILISFTFDCLEHNLTEHTANDATCIADGNIAYWTCSNCSNYFANAEGSALIADANKDGKITLDDTVIATAGHSYGAVSYVWADDQADCTATRTCSNCAEDVEGHTQTATSTSHTIYEITTQPTCTTPGEADYLVTFDVDWIDGAQTISGLYPKSSHVLTDYDLDMDNHWGECTECKANIKEAHSFGDDSKCVCGFVKGTNGVKYRYDYDLKTYFVEMFSVSSDATDVDVVIANYYDDGNNGFLPVTYIYSYAFGGNKELRVKIKSVVIPEGITKIDANAFTNCTNLVSVTLPDSLEYLGASAFEGTAWEKFYLDAQSGGEVYIDNILYTYKGTMPADYTLNVKEGTKFISSYAFKNQSNLKVVNMPDSLAFIGYEAFRNCSKLQTIEIGANVKIIAKYAFQECSGLQTVAFNSKLETIEKYAFYDCSGIKTLTIPSNVKTIGPDAFYSMALLESVVIEGSGLTSIDEGAFSSCPKLTSITFSVSLERLKEISKGVWYTYSPVVMVYYDGGSFKVHYDKVDATCTEDGKIEYWYNFIDGKNYSKPNFSSSSVIEGSLVITALGHTGGTATCQQKAKCAKCGNEYGNLGEHDYEWVKSAEGHYRQCKTENCTEKETLKEHDFKEGVCRDCGEKDILGTEGLLYEYNAQTQTYTVTGYEGADDHVKIPYYYNDGTNGVKVVGGIGEGAFAESYYYLDIETITVPNGITFVGDHAFDNLEYLTYTELNNNSYLGSKDNPYTVLVKGNLSWNDLTVNAKIIYYRAFYDGWIKNVTLGEDVIYIGTEAFSNNSIKTVFNQSSLDIVKGSKTHGSVAEDAVNIYTAGKVGDFTLWVGGSEDIVVSYDGDSSSIVFPDYFTEGKTYSVSEYIFPNNTTITSVYFGTGVTSIGQSAFRYARALKTVTFADNCQLTKLNPYAFSQCSSLQSISFGKNSKLEIIDYSVFAGSSALREIDIPDSVTKIEHHAFNCTYGLTKVNFGEKSKLTTIGENAFNEATSLVSFTLPASVTSVSSYAFSKCYKLFEVINLSSLNLEKGTETNGGIAKYAKVIKGAGDSSSMVYREDGYIFFTHSETDSVTSQTITTNYLMGYIGEQTALTLPTDYNGSAYELAPYFLASNKSIKSVVITVGNVSDGAFCYCTSLRSVTFASGYSGEIIGRDAFISTMIQHITIPASITVIKNSAFSNFQDQGCLKTVDFEDNSNLTTIEAYAFIYCSDLVSFTLPAKVTSIGIEAFYGCTSLKEVINLSSLDIQVGSDDYGQIAKHATVVLSSREDATLPDENGYIFMTANGVNYLMFYTGTQTQLTLPESYNGEQYEIANNAFKNNEITSVVIPKNVTAIGDGAFENCSLLKTVTFEADSALLTIGVRAFKNCAISAITIPKNVTAMGNMAFENCSLLKTVIFEEDIKLETLGGVAFNSCTALLSITLPKSLKNIGLLAFWNCSALETVTIEKGSMLQTIGDSAFLNCYALKTINIPDSITFIGIDAFNGCSNLIYTTYCDAYYLGNTTNPYVVLVKATNTGLDFCTIHENTKIIFHYAFENCRNMDNVEIPDGVACIGKNAFNNCDLFMVSMPSSVTYIGEYAFANGYYYSDVILEYRGDEWQWNAIQKGESNNNIGVRENNIRC